MSQSQRTQPRHRSSRRRGRPQKSSESGGLDNVNRRKDLSSHLRDQSSSSSPYYGFLLFLFVHFVAYIFVYQYNPYGVPKPVSSDVSGTHCSIANKTNNIRIHFCLFGPQHDIF